MEHVSNMHETKTQPSEVVAPAQQGDAATVTVHTEGSVGAQPKPGLMRDEWPPVPWHSFAPMSDQEVTEWGL